MRWSLILSTFLTVLSTFSAALVIPTSESLVDLERRAGGANLKASSSNINYYETHDSAYEFDHTGAETHLIFFSLTSNLDEYLKDMAPPVSAKVNREVRLSLKEYAILFCTHLCPRKAS